MITSPCEDLSALRVGTVIYVSPEEIKVQLEVDAPDSVALNAGYPRAFPRVNSYILIPAEGGFIVGQVQWITVENSPYPKRKGLQDFGLIDLPFPLRKLSLAPLGILHKKAGADAYSFSRGIESFPSIGDEAVLPTKNQLHAIVRSGDNLRVKIGVSPLAGNADVCVDPDRLFGRHLAVLGNTGSGKSCSVAGLIRWSLEAARKEVAGRRDRMKISNSRFVILDPNGEYGHTFATIPGTSVYSVRPSESSIEQLKLPLWFWNTDEWCAFARASDKTQRPLISQTLQSLRAGVKDVVLSKSVRMRQYLRTLLIALRTEIQKGTPWTTSVRGFRDRVVAWSKDLVIDSEYTEGEQQALSKLVEWLPTFLKGHEGDWPAYFERKNVEMLRRGLTKTYLAFGGGADDALMIDPDTPKPFSASDFVGGLSANALILNVADYVETMTLRIKTLLSDPRISDLCSVKEDYTIADWLNAFLGGEVKKTKISVIDLSLVPSNIVHIVTAAIARIIMESLQRYRKCNNGETLPTTLVVEEAHTFIKRYTDEYDDQSAGTICCKVFEKIAREGRKFGLGMVLSSQRPSELSPTVLSQCNTFLLHRISNDRDQELVLKLLPDNLHGLLRDLPVLPSRHAVLLGWAAELPVLVKMNELQKEHRPQSDDPDFWAVWTGERECKFNWKEIETDWTTGTTSEDESVSDMDEDNRATVQLDSPVHNDTNTED